MQQAYFVTGVTGGVSGSLQWEPLRVCAAAAAGGGGGGQRAGGGRSGGAMVLDLEKFIEQVQTTLSLQRPTGASGSSPGRSSLTPSPAPRCTTPGKTR